MIYFLSGLRYECILGGDSIEKQFAALHDNPDVIFATPGRFVHLCVEMSLKLTEVEYVVFDEADRLFEMGFGEQLREILGRLPESRQTVLFSATLPKMLVDFAKAGLSDPTLIRLNVESKVPETLKMAFFYTRGDMKDACLLHLLKVRLLPNFLCIKFFFNTYYLYFKAVLKNLRKCVFVKLLSLSLVFFKYDILYLHFLSHPQFLFNEGCCRVCFFL